MLERLMSFLKELPGVGDADQVPGADDPRVAAAALMFHVIDADGVREDAERKKLRQVLADAYSVSGSELEGIITAAEKAEREAVDLFAFTSVLNRQLDGNAKIEFIGILWEMVYADGESHELEDNIVWRVAELIGVSPRDRVLMRQKVRGDAAGDGDD
ncbi:TerB family tellurite resistance protein [Aquamicrobium sp. LC103]|uniref:tellurite resistance TerB family protein n=1 Tax=Aquamicrobium sp. LC103 TaxID=1120658 RepID=UPI00063E7D01|nr:TerB family tellurite resistance protein [Aquamicrobium sp. LC103]TKT82934.1 hypothetical protein XW59_002930 [Aquamicrobium sp. LC103]